MNSRPNVEPADPERTVGTATPTPPRGPLRLADAVDRFVAVCAQTVIVVTGCALLLLLAGNVVARYALGGGFPFAQELPERIFPLFIMAGIALAAQRGGHMAVEFLPDLFGRRGAQALRIFAQLCVIAGHVMLVVVALQVAFISGIDLSPVLGLPASWSYYALAAGALGVILTTSALVMRLAVLGPEAMPQPNPEETGQ